MAKPETYEFASDTHRRVAGNLTQPRSAADLARLLAALDPFVVDGAYTPNGVESFLKDLEADGMVKQVGTFDDPAAAIKSFAGDADLIDIPKVKAANIAERAENPVKYPFLDSEDQWLLAKRGLEALTAPGENVPPPLEGLALKGVEDANAKLAKEDEERAREEALRVAKGLRERADEIEKGLKK